MAYFPHAFHKLLVGTNATSFMDGNDTTGSNGTTLTTALAAGQIGIVSAKNNKVVDLDGTPSYANYPMIYLAQGSFHANDKIGPFHGGYKETVKSKGINPKYVSAFYVTEPSAPVSHAIQVFVKDCTKIKCDSTYRLRLDVKGSPALRFLTHNLYQTLDAKTPCCDTDENNTDPVSVLLQWKDQINASPIVKQFVNAKVFTQKAFSTGESAGSTPSTSLSTNTGSASVGDMVYGTGIPANTFIASVIGSGSYTLTKAATVAPNTALSFYGEVSTDTYVAETGPSNPDTNDAFLLLTGAYVDTTFGNCSFSPMDHVELEPVLLYASVVDQTGDPCETTCFTISELQTAYQGKGFGETLLRELILSKRYEQEPWVQDPRLREVLDNTALSEISRTSRYYVYHILHSVPRKSNPTGMMDSDQYLVKIVVSARSGNAAKFETWMNTLLSNSGNHVQLTTLA